MSLPIEATRQPSVKKSRTGSQRPTVVYSCFGSIAGRKMGGIIFEKYFLCLIFYLESEVSCWFLQAGGQVGFFLYFFLKKA